MSALVQYLNFLKQSSGKNEKKEKSAELKGYEPSVAGALPETDSSEEKPIAEKALVNSKASDNINNVNTPAAVPHTSAEIPAVTTAVHNPSRGNSAEVPRPLTPKKFTSIPRVLENLPKMNTMEDPRSGTLLDKRSSVKVARNTGIVDVDGEIYVNTDDVELLGKLGFDYSCEEYLGLAKTGEVLDVYSYVEKVAGVPREVAKLVDDKKAFSAEYLKDMGYGVPKGYEVKGDLVCPIEKKASKERVRVVLPYENQYLLEKLMNPKWPDNYGKRRFPGGGIDEGETPAQAASREFMEELGINASPDKFEYMGLDPASGNHYLKLTEHGLAPGKYKASVGSDPYIYLEQGLPEGLDYLGADIGKFAPVEKTEQSFQQTGKEEKESSEKTAAADPKKTILITGHSGSGKSTLGKALAEKLNLPLHRVDAQTSWDDLRARLEKNPELERKALTPGTAENKKYIKDVRKIVHKSLKEINGPAVLEGTQLTTLPANQLKKYNANILVGGDVSQSIAQRLQRMTDKAAKKGITLSPEQLAKKIEESQLVAGSWHPGIEKFRKLPGVLSYNHTEHQIDPLVERLKQLMKKSEALVVSGIHGDEPAGNIAAKKLDGKVDTVTDVNPTEKRRFEGKDINRHFDKPSAGSVQKRLLDLIETKKPSSVISLHEDDEIDKPYAYSSETMADKVKKALRGKRVASSAHGDITDKGVISEGKNPPEGSLEKALDKRDIPHATIETPSKSKNIDDRTKIHTDVIKSLLNKESSERLGLCAKTASRLRDNVNITTLNDPSGLIEYIASIGDKKIGNMLVADSKYKGKVIAHSLIDPEFRGMGLGKKLYGEVMRRQPEGVLHSGPVMSEDAQRVWASLNKNKGYEITGEVPELMGRINEKALNIPNKVKKLRSVVSAVEAKGSLFDKIKKLIGIAKKAEYKWYKSKDLHRDVTNGRHYPFSFLTGEAKELVDAIKNRDMANFKEEIGDTTYAAQMLAAQLTGLNHPVYADLSKFHKREKVWKDMFKEKGGVYHPKHMEGGSNFAKASKIIKAFASAGIKVNQREAERLANKYTGGKMEKEAAADVQLKSSNIDSVGHDKKTKLLEVLFRNGAQYEYKDVPRKLYSRLLKAKSPGKFFNKHIKRDNPFEYSKINKE